MEAENYPIIMAATNRTIKLVQLAQHASPDSLWVAVYGRGTLTSTNKFGLELTESVVYDLTSFRSDHPGGTEALEACAGTDGTESFEYAGHSKSSMTKMQQYCIGQLEGAVVDVPELPRDQLRAEKLRRSIKKPGSKLVQFVSKWVKVVIIVMVVTVTLLLIYSSRNRFSQTLPMGGGKPKASTLSVHRAFWAGLALAGSFACVVARYFYKLFLATLDYENEVFSFPATIPKKSKR